MEYSENEIQHAINRLCRFRAVITVRIFFLILFLLFTIYALITHYPIYSFYFLVLCVILPPALTSILRKKKKSAANSCERIFPVLSKKYHFSESGCAGELFTFYFILILLIFWQNSIRFSDLPGSLYYIFPFTVLFLGLLLFVSLSLFFRLQMRKNLRNGSF